VSDGGDLHRRLDEKIATAELGGSETARAKQLAAGKLLVRQRLALLLDDDGDVFEDGLLARSEEGLAGDALVTVIGKVDGRPVAVIANDFTVKAGTWGKRTFEKYTYTQERAAALGIPLVYLVDAAGARIDEQFDSYAGRHAWANIFYNLVQFSGRVPQVCALFGPSPAGSAYVPGLCDYVVMVRGGATAYIGSPRLAEMVIGEHVSMEDMGGAEMHCTTSGLGDCLVESDAEAIAALRVWLSYLPSSWQEKPPSLTPGWAPAPPVRPVEEIVPDREEVPYDVVELIQAIVDEGTFLPYKELFAPELVCGFARLGGQSVGIVANQSIHKAGVLFTDSSDKAARFIWICNAFGIPLLFLCDNAGYMIGSDVERGGIIRHGAKMLFAVCEATVPRIQVIVRKAYGGGYIAMSGSPTKPDAVLALPTAKPALMGSAAAINAIHYNRIMAITDEDERKAFIENARAEYAAGIDVFKLASENVFSEVVPVARLRDDLIARFAVYSRRPAEPAPRRNGVYPV
jgi:acetyl-CoA carboxylase carboxyltransferase component